MAYEARKFVQESYDTNDAWGRQVVIDFLRSRGLEVEEKTEEDYGIDIVAISKSGKRTFFEAEVKRKRPWTGRDDFPFDSVSFLGRKRKWSGDGGFWYVVVCAETKALIICHSDVIYQDAHKEFAYINTQHRKGNDELYRVPNDLCYWTR